jgi:hypothetical protein
MRIDVSSRMLKEVWERFSNSIEGTITNDESKFPLGSYFKSKIEYQHNNYSINFYGFKRSSTVPSGRNDSGTQVFVPLDKELKLRFKIYPENIGVKLLKYFGFQDVIIGSKNIDKKYIFKGDERIVKYLFGNSKVQQILMTDDFNLKIQEGKGAMDLGLPEGKNFLILKSDELIVDEELLSNILELFKVVLDKMAELK